MHEMMLDCGGWRYCVGRHKLDLALEEKVFLMDDFEDYKEDAERKERMLKVEMEVWYLALIYLPRVFSVQGNLVKDFGDRDVSCLFVVSVFS